MQLIIPGLSHLLGSISFGLLLARLITRQEIRKIGIPFCQENYEANNL